MAVGSTYDQRADHRSDSEPDEEIVAQASHDEPGNQPGQDPRCNQAEDEFRGHDDLIVQSSNYLVAVRTRAQSRKASFQSTLSGSGGVMAW